MPLASAADATSWPRSPCSLRLLALERGEPVERNQVLLQQVAHAGELLVDESELLILGVLLRGEPGDLLLQLLDALRELILLAEPRGATQFKQLALAVQSPP